MDACFWHIWRTIKERCLKTLAISYFYILHMLVYIACLIFHWFMLINLLLVLLFIIWIDHLVRCILALTLYTLHFLKKTTIYLQYQIEYFHYFHIRNNASWFRCTLSLKDPTKPIMIPLRYFHHLYVYITPFMARHGPVGVVCLQTKHLSPALMFLCVNDKGSYYRCIRISIARIYADSTQWSEYI